VRGLYPWPHAYTYLNGERLILLRTRVETASAAVPPGTILDASSDLIRVATGHAGQIAIEELQPEGRRGMKAREFLAGHTVQAGARLSSP
jgi:methionyl-tRNA formyltransferase